MRPPWPEDQRCRSRPACLNPIRCVRRCHEPGCRSPARSFCLARQATWPIASSSRRSTIWLGQGTCPAECAIVGFARRDWTDDDLRADYEKSLSKEGDSDFREIWPQFASRLVFSPGTFDDAEGYRKLKEKLEELDRTHGTRGNRIYYLAVSPEFFATIIAHLGEAGLIYPWQQETPWSRVVIEKPFGHDLASARALNRDVSRVLDEGQVYRIDHYLGKETVQNILAFRFGNSIFEPIWNRRHVDSVQITVAEEVGMAGGRGAYYDTAGAIRDMVQNHMMQLLSLVAMEPPVDLSADAVRNEKVKVLQALPDWKPEDVYRNVVRAQYTAGSIEGDEVPGYLQEKGVKPDSKTSPYVAIRLELNTWRWAGVPFFLRTGKRLPKRATEIAIQFRRPPDRAIRARGRRPQRRQPARPADPTQRGGEPLLRGQDPRLAPPASGSADGLPLRHRLRRPAARGLRAPAPRRDARRPDPVHPHRRGRERLAVHHRDPRRLGAARRPAPGRLPRRQLGTRPRPTNCSRPTESSGDGCDHRGCPSNFGDAR